MSQREAVTPFGGLVSLFEFFNKIGLPPKLTETMPFTLGSPNAIPPAYTLMASVISVVAGARRFAHADWLRFDKALHALLGIAGFPGADTVHNLFARFNQCAIEAFWRPLVAVSGEAQCVLHAWLRSGNTSASRGVWNFLSEALELVPAHWKIRCVRADSGFLFPGTL